MDAQNLYTIEDGKVFLNKTAGSPKRELAAITDETKDAILETLIQKFEEIQKEWAEFKAQFDEEKEVTKLAGKLSRKKSFFSEAKAIGDYEPIFKEIKEVEQKIEARVTDVINQKQAFIVQIENLTKEAPKTHQAWQEATSQMSAFKKAFFSLPQVPHPDDAPAKEKIEAAVVHFLDVKEKFYDGFKIELAANLDRKMQLCERAEGIKDSDDWRKTSDTYAQLLELWKAVGPVPRHKSDELWMRFNNAKDHFYTRKQAFYGELIGNLEENLKAKEEIITQVEALKDSTEWKKTTEKMNGFMDAWKKIGGVGKEKNDEVWNRFNAARDVFFTNKKNFFASRKLELENNLLKKKAIAKRAEELKESNDFEQASEEYQELMKDWKATGYAGKKEGDEQWELFIAAKKHFFARKDEWRDGRREELLEEINDKIGRDIGFMNKIKKELAQEQDVVTEFTNKIKEASLSPSSFEKKERYEQTIEEAKQNIEKLQKKIDDVQAKVDVNKKERGRLYYWQKKKEEEEMAANPELAAQKAKEREEKAKARKESRTKKDFKPRDNKGPQKTMLGEALKGLNLNLED